MNGIKKFLVVAVAVVLCAGIFYGCGKKQQSLEEMQAPMSSDTLGGQPLDNRVVMQDIQPPAQPLTTQEKQIEMPLPPQSSATLEPLPPAGPYKPSAEDIQSALKNAGYYTGNVDGKIGPKSKAAIEAFQKANGLVVDGKVGPKTWAVLEPYMKSSSLPAEETQLSVQ